jgi:hypothetical protein
LISKFFKKKFIILNPFVFFLFSLSRFLLVGTREGLWVVDLLPALSKSSTLATLTVEDAQSYQIWSGQAVYQLQVLLDPEDGADDGGANRRSSRAPGVRMSGIVIGLVGSSDGPESDGGKSVKLWPLQVNFML